MAFLKNSKVMEELEDFITAGEAAKQLSSKFGVKIRAKDLEPFTDQWRTVGLFKGVDGNKHGRRVWIFQPHKVETLKLEQILAAKKTIELHDVEGEKFVKGWFVLFKKEQINIHKRMGWKPYLGLYSGAASAAPSNLTLLSNEEFECAKLQEGRRMKPFEAPDFTSKNYVLLKAIEIDNELAKQQDALKRQEENIIQLELLRKEKEIKEILLADYVLKARKEIEKVGGFKFADKNEDTGKFEEYSLKRMLLKLYHLNPSPVFIIWNYVEVTKKIAAFYEIPERKESESSLKLAVRALWHVLGIEKIIAENVLLNIESRKEKDTSSLSLRDEIKIALDKCDPIIKLEVFKSRSENEFIQNQISEYYDALETAVAQGKNLVDAEIIARKVCFHEINVTIEDKPLLKNRNIIRI